MGGTFRNFESYPGDSNVLPRLAYLPPTSCFRWCLLVLKNLLWDASLIWPWPHSPCIYLYHWPFQMELRTIFHVCKLLEYNSNILLFFESWCLSQVTHSKCPINICGTELPPSQPPWNQFTFTWLLVSDPSFLSPQPLPHLYLNYYHNLLTRLSFSTISPLYPVFPPSSYIILLKLIQNPVQVWARTVIL